MTINPGRFNGHLPDVAIDKRKINRVEKATDIAKAEKASVVNPAAGADEVILSSRAQELQQVKKIVQGLPDVREENIQAIQSQLQNGTYNPDTDKIAGKMIRIYKIDKLA